MSRLTLIIGGTRSGKSTQAVTLARGLRRVAFLATAMPMDGEMRERIGRHRAHRPRSWKTFEDPKTFPRLLAGPLKRCDAVILDGVGMWISYFLSYQSVPDLTPAGRQKAEKAIYSKVDELLRAVSKSRARVIVVAEEAGMGLVPDNPLARFFRDLNGRVNQVLMAKADEAFWMVAGVPVQVKGTLRLGPST